MKADTAYIYGRNAIIESLSNPERIAKIFISYGSQGEAISRIYRLAKKAKVQCVRHDKRKFQTLEKSVLPRDAKSQGIIALMNIISTVTVEDMIRKAKSQADLPVLVALDGINDPHNLGAIARSAECAGAGGIILPDRNSAPLTPTAMKASAGALEHIPVAMAGNLSQALELCKDNGFWVIGTDSDGDKFYNEESYDRPIVLVIGSEGKGLRPGIKKNCDAIVKIPLKGRISSLNASVAAGVMLFEILRQKG